MQFFTNMSHIELMANRYIKNFNTYTYFKKYDTNYNLYREKKNNITYSLLHVVMATPCMS